MPALLALKGHPLLSPVILVLSSFLLLLSWQNPGALARVPSSRQQIALSSGDGAEPAIARLAHSTDDPKVSLPSTLDAMLDAISVMQDRYFEIGLGTWPDSIDWTAAVLGTHVSATLSTLISSIDSSTSSATACADALAWDNLINRYFAHTSVFYFGENALSIRQQAYDDILWVVLGWLENVKLMDVYTSLRSKDTLPEQGKKQQQLPPWHGTQFKPAAAHRARLFYDLATRGWDTSLCGGGMIWSPHLQPYKNSVTNELFISASISMYLYFPGDENDSPFWSAEDQPSRRTPHNPQHLENAIEAYAWLKASHMKSPDRGTPSLYADGFHISGWRREPSGHINPGTGRCDDLNTMIYTYNQGVVLTGLRDLWLATGEASYLDDGHDLIDAVVAATGWWSRDRKGGMRQWAGLGRGGVLEEYCDASGRCSQNEQPSLASYPRQSHHITQFLCVYIISSSIRPLLPDPGSPLPLLCTSAPLFSRSGNALPLPQRSQHRQPTALGLDGATATSVIDVLSATASPTEILGVWLIEIQVRVGCMEGLLKKDRRRMCRFRGPRGFLAPLSQIRGIGRIVVVVLMINCSPR